MNKQISKAYFKYSPTLRCWTAIWQEAGEARTRDFQTKEEAVQYIKVVLDPKP